jgi:thymidylate synthase
MENSFEKNMITLTPDDTNLEEKQENTNYMNELYSNGNVSERIFSNIKKFQHEEYQYLNLLENILENGILEEGRNGKTKSIFGQSMRFSLENGKIPILTTKKTAWKTCLKELLWFISGETNNKILKEQNVHIWDANGSREFLDSRGLIDYEVDELGPIYSWQWRKFNKPYFSNNGKQSIFQYISYIFHSFSPEYKMIEQSGVDQLQQIIDTLKDPKQRNSRRLIMTSWNPCQLDQMALPPCHILCQFSVKNNNQLSCAMYQRSCDVFLGSCFNIASYSMLTHLLAKHCGLEANEFIYFMGNCHLYDNAIEASILQRTREPYEFPTISITKVKENINDYSVEDFEIHNYQHHSQIKVDMVA